MYTLDVEKRDCTAKAKKLRRMGIIPGSINGRHLPENLLIQLSAVAAKKFLREKGKGAELTLNCDGASYHVLLKEITRAPLDGQIQDLSFQVLTEGETFNGAAQIVLRNADKINVPVQKLVHEIPYRALPANLTEIVEIDLSKLRTGDRVKVSDLSISKVPEIEVLLAADTLVLNIEGR
ncbi:MAG: hypothetical protein PHV18_05975 [Lachnospiraceae bacterium]|nr:hypothetical protein [Lachnospiraceae bacterium]